jgi:hypothetical protein
MTQTVTKPLVEVLVPMVEMDKGEREYRTFLRLLRELLVSHLGQSAAVHDGEVVDFDKQPGGGRKPPRDHAEISH